MVARPLQLQGHISYTLSLDKQTWAAHQKTRPSIGSLFSIGLVLQYQILICISVALPLPDNYVYLSSKHSCWGSVSQFGIAWPDKGQYVWIWSTANRSRQLMRIQPIHNHKSYSAFTVLRQTHIISLMICDVCSPQNKIETVAQKLNIC